MAEAVQAGPCVNLHGAGGGGHQHHFGPGFSLRPQTLPQSVIS